MRYGRPICYASIAPTPTKERYAVVEKEMQAVLFSVKKFNQYAFGTKTTIHSDHKPPQSILKKSLDKAKRLQGMILATQLYDYEV